jgi:mono/diheme cytochrome c family protein
MAIASTNGAPLRAAPGDALPLAVVFTMSDGSTRSLPATTAITWKTPSTVVAQDPNDAGTSGILDDSGTHPHAFYVANDFRPDHPGVLFVTSQGTDVDASVTVTAVLPDGGALSAVVGIDPAPVGDATRGQNLFQTVLQCSGCHGATGGGSDPATYVDGGVETADGSVLYDLQGQLYPFPAPGLNNAPDSGNLATDPNWNAALLGMAAQADIDNFGVALRAPMPVWLGKQGAGTQPLNAQDFADIYAWLKAQTQ